MTTPAPQPRSLTGRAASALARSGRRPAARLALVAASLALTFAAGTHSSSEGHEADALREALRRGADRLVGLQSPGSETTSNLKQVGRSGRALLLAWQVTGDPRHFLAARQAARVVAREVQAGRNASSCNLLLLAEMGREAGQPSLVEIARNAWLTRFQSASPEDGAEAARQLLQAPPSRDVRGGDWRNYLLGRAAEEAQVARALGYEAWADAFIVEAAGTWSPKHDHDYWASAAGALLGALSESSHPEARRLARAQLGLLEANAILDGISWNDTPYDTYVHASETAEALAGRALSAGGRADEATLAGLQFLASRQAPHGGWGSVLSLIEEVAAEGDDELPPAAAAAEETASLDAQVVEALALGLGARG